MIINTSRATQFQQCRTKAYNWHELRLLSHREEDVLQLGEAYHLGSEYLTKTGNVQEAEDAAVKRYRERISNQMILPEEQVIIERNIEWIRHSVREWGRNYDKAEFTVLRPEVPGCVPLPGTEHHCWFVHRLIYPDIPYNQCSGDYKCTQPHFFKFRTDGLIEMYKKVWLLEQKTTSQAGNKNFWDKFHLDFQTTGYCYGVWKATGIMPHGFLLNAVIKHHKQRTFAGERKYELDPTNVGFAREPFLVTEDRMLDWEKEMTQIANDYELAFREGRTYKNTSSCFAYNRRCYYFDSCVRGSIEPGEYRDRNPDYVDLAYYELLGITPPKEDELVEVNRVS